MRFLVPLNIFLVFPSAVGLNYLYRFFIGDKSRKVKIVSSLVIVYFFITILATPYYHLFKKKDFRLVYNVPEQFNELVSWIKNNTTKEGRILIENSDFESGHVYYKTHLPFLLPMLTKREYMDVYSYYAVTKDSFSSFNSGILFRKPIKNYSLQELQQYLNLYNIKWIIYWTDEAKNFFESYPEYFIFKNKIDRFYICEVNRNPSFFIKGNGKIVANYNVIELNDIQPVDNEIIISYHWMKYFKGKPFAEIREKKFLGDPVGFIYIKNPPKSLLIYNNYKL